MVYQTFLLAGYAYAHFAASWLGARRQALLHLVLALAALSLLPVALPLDWLKTPMLGPVNLVLAVLTVSVGFPFFVLSAGAPLLQKWFAQGAHSAARDPYFLYAASNAGSLAGLLGYPLLLEPRLTLTQQNQLWLSAYVVLLALMAVCVWCFLWPARMAPHGTAHVPEESEAARSAASDVTFARRLRWIASSFVPSSLLLGVTSYLTTDVASAPLFWVIPLACYLLTFIIAFACPGSAVNSFVLRLQTIALLAAASTMFLGATKPSWLILPLHLVAFLLTSLVCHGQLAQDRPHPRQLTKFYLLISIGGVLGGVFNALLAPALFRGVVEYPLAIAAAAFIRPYNENIIDSPVHRRVDWLLPPAALALIVLDHSRNEAVRDPAGGERSVADLWSRVRGLSCLCSPPATLRSRIDRVHLISMCYPSPAGTLLFADRSFFGSYRAILQAEDKRHVLFQETTVHGAQSLDERLRLQPLTYYHRTDPRVRCSGALPSCAATVMLPSSN